MGIFAMNESDHHPAWKQLVGSKPPQVLRTIVMPSQWFQQRKADISADFPTGLKIQPRCPPFQKCAPILALPTLDSTPMSTENVSGFIQRTQQLLYSNQTLFDLAYTDGSRIDKKATKKCRRKIGCASACVYFEVDREAKSVTKYEYSEPCQIQTPLECELEAIKLALQHAISRSRNVKIFCDSVSAIRMLQSAKLTSPIAIQCHQLLRESSLQIHISHCLGHVGIPGNEEVHTLANRTAKHALSEISRTPSTRQSIDV